MATVEELVIQLMIRTDNAEQQLEKLDKEVKEIKQASSEAENGLDKVSSASEKTARSSEKAGRGARKAGDEIERAGRKADRSSILFDKAQRRLTKGWIKSLSGYMIGLVAAGSVIGFIKDAIGKTLDGATAIGKVSDATGRTREEVHALGAAFRSLSLDEQSAYKYLEDFNNGKYDRAAQTIGIRTQSKGQRRSGEDVLLDMGRKAVQDSGGDKDLAAKRLQAIGLEENAAKAAVKATRELIDEKQRDGRVTEDQIRRAEDVNKKFSALAGSLGEVKEAFGYAILPIVEDVTDGIEGLIDFIKGVSEGFEDASGGTGIFQVAVETLLAPIKILIGFVEALFEGLGKVSDWAENGGRVVYGFFTAMQVVWNAVIGVINRLLAWIEALINGLNRLGVAIDNLAGGNAVYQEVKLGRVNDIGSNGGGAAAWKVSEGSGSGRGTVRGSWGMPGAGRGGGRGGRGRSGGGGRRVGGGSAGKEEPIYRSTYQGTADPKRLGMRGAIGKIAEDPAKVAAREAKKAGRAGMSAGAKQVASAAMQTFNFNNSITVNAQGNPNARDIATRTADAVSMVSRRQAGAMA